jgi:hypothetical protein
VTSRPRQGFVGRLQIKVSRTLRFAPGTILAIDRGYIEYVRPFQGGETT